MAAANSNEQPMPIQTNVAPASNQWQAGRSQAGGRRAGTLSWDAGETTKTARGTKRLQVRTSRRHANGAYDSGSIEADIEPLHLGIRSSLPNEWICSIFSSACSLVVVRQITRPEESTSFAN